MTNKFIILDFGSQYTGLLTRRFREMGFFCIALPYNAPLSQIKKEKPLGLILSGGPRSVKSRGAPRRSIKELLDIAPALGICYGMQLAAQDLGGRVESSPGKGRYGRSFIVWKKSLLPRLKKQKVWMSHGDFVKKLPPKAHLLAESEERVISSFASDDERLLALQFHPEVSHTARGLELLRHFAFKMCRAKKVETWNAKAMLSEAQNIIQKTVPKKESVLCALSGGVDSTVTAVLLSQILGKKRVPCFFVDTGLLRLNEFEEVLKSYKKLNLNVKGIKEGGFFLKRLRGIKKPEEKRKAIGRAFIEVFKKYKSPKIKYLAQGTIYPDVIESLSPLNTVIKSHHNVGGLPKNLNLKLVEPLRLFFKDEIRLLGRNLKIPPAFLKRHPFPGPGLSIRILGEVTKEKVHILQRADAIFIGELKKSSLYDQIWQAFCVLLDSRSVGVQGDDRSYGCTLCLRAVTSLDGMTADWFSFEDSFLKGVSAAITNEIRSINRVVYDISSKPPGTIEWE